ncbi:MAG: hypothetical protein WBS24_00220 [Terriglobales bacterium]
MKTRLLESLSAQFLVEGIFKGSMAISSGPDGRANVLGRMFNINQKEFWIMPDTKNQGNQGNQGSMGQSSTGQGATGEDQKNQQGNKQNNPFSEQEKHREHSQHQKPQNQQQQQGGGTQSVPRRGPGNENSGNEDDTQENEKTRKSA